MIIENGAEEAANDTGLTDLRVESSLPDFLHPADIAGISGLPDHVYRQAAQTLDRPDVMGGLGARTAPMEMGSYDGIERNSAPLRETDSERFRLIDALNNGAQAYFLPNSPGRYVQLNPAEEAGYKAKVHEVYDAAERAVKTAGAVDPGYLFAQRPLYIAMKYLNSNDQSPSKNNVDKADVQSFDNYGAYAGFLNSHPDYGRMGGWTKRGGSDRSTIYLSGALDPTSSIQLPSASLGQKPHFAMRPSEALATRTLLHEYDHGHNKHEDEKRPEQFADRWLGTQRSWP